VKGRCGGFHYPDVANFWLHGQRLRADGDALHHVQRIHPNSLPVDGPLAGELMTLSPGDIPASPWHIHTDLTRTFGELTAGLILEPDPTRCANPAGTTTNRSRSDPDERFGTAEFFRSYAKLPEGIEARPAQEQIASIETITTPGPGARTAAPAVPPGPIPGRMDSSTFGWCQTWDTIAASRNICTTSREFRPTPGAVGGGIDGAGLRFSYGSDGRPASGNCRCAGRRGALGRTAGARSDERSKTCLYNRDPFESTSMPSSVSLADGTDSSPSPFHPRKAWIPVNDSS
jgi:hypothetical protein